MGQRSPVWGSFWIRIGVAGSGAWAAIVAAWVATGAGGSLGQAGPGSVAVGVFLPLLLLWLVVAVLSHAEFAARQDALRVSVDAGVTQLALSHGELSAALTASNAETLAFTRMALDETLSAARKAMEDTLSVVRKIDEETLLLTRHSVDQAISTSRKANEESLALTRNAIEQAIAAFRASGDEAHAATRRTLEEALAAAGKADAEALALTSRTLEQSLAMTRKADEESLALTRQAFEESQAVMRQALERTLALTAAQAEGARQHAEFIARQASLLSEQRDLRDRDARNRLAAARLERLAQGIPSRLRHWKIFEGGLAATERFEPGAGPEAARHLFARLEAHMNGLMRRIREHPMDVVLVEEPLSSLVDLRADLIRVSGDLPADDPLMQESLAADRLPSLIATIDELIGLTTANIQTK